MVPSPCRVVVDVGIVSSVGVVRYLRSMEAVVIFAFVWHQRSPFHS